MSNLPLVGVIATIQGLASFQAASQQVSATLQGLNKGATDMAKSSSSAWSTTADAALGASKVIVGAWAVVTAALATAEAASVKSAANIQQSFAAIGAIGGASTAQLTDLGTLVTRIAQSTTVSAGAASAAALDLIRNGLTMTQVLGGALQAVVNLNISSGGLQTLAQSSLAVATSMAAFSKEGVTATQVADVLAVASQHSILNFNDFQVAMQHSGTVASALGLSLRDTAAATVALGEAGVRGGLQGVQSLRIILEDMLKPSTRATELMKQYRISLFDASGAVRPFRDFLLDLHDRFGDQAVAAGKLTAAERDFALETIFTNNTLKASIAFANDGVEAFDRVSASLKDGAAADIAEKMLVPLNAQLTILQNIAGTAAIAVGTTLLPVLQRGVTIAQDFLKSLDPKALGLFGQAIQGLGGQTSLAEVFKTIGEVFKPDVAVVLISILTVFRNIGAAIHDQILPAALALWDSIRTAVGGTNGVQQLVIFFSNLSDGIRTAAQVVANFLGDITRLVTAIGNNATAVDIFKRALAGLAAIPIAGLLSLFLTLVGNIASVVVPLALVGEGFVLLASVAQRIDWAPVGAQVVALAGFFRDNLAIAIGIASLALATFATVRMAQFVASIAPVLVVIGLVIADLATMAVQAGIASAAFIFMAVSAIGSTLITAVNALASGLAIVFAELVIGTATILANTVAWTANAIAGLGAWLVKLPLILTGLALQASLFLALLPTIAASTAAYILNAVAGIGGVIASIPRLVVALAAAVVGFATTATSAVASAIAIATAWGTTLVGVVVAGVGAILTAIGPFLLGVAVIAAVILLVAKAWQDNWFNMRDTVTNTNVDIIRSIANVTLALEEMIGADDAVTAATRTFFLQMQKDTSLAATAIRDELSDVSSAIDDAISTLQDGVPDAIKLWQDLQQQIKDAKDAAANQPGPVEIPTPDAALPDFATTTPAVFDFAGALKDANAQAAALKAGITTLHDALTILTRESERALEAFSTGLAKIQSNLETKTNEALQNTAKEITKVYLDAFRKIQDAADAVDLNRVNRGRTEALTEELAREAVARSNSIDDANTAYDRDVANAKLAREHQAQDADTAFKEMQVSADQAFQQEVASASQAAQQEEAVQVEALRQVQAERILGLTEQFRMQNLLRTEAQRTADEAAKVQEELAGATTQAERNAILARANIQRQDSGRQAAFAITNANIQASQSQQLEAQRQLDQDATQQATQRNAQTDLARSQSNALAQTAFKRTQDEEYTAFKRTQDALLADAERADQDAATKRKRQQSIDDVAFNLGQAREQQRLTDTIEDEALIRNAQRTNKDAQTRVNALNQALIDTQAGLVQAANDATTALQTTLDTHLANLQQGFLDKLPDLLSRAGDAIRPAITNIGDMITEQLLRIQTAATYAAVALGLATGGTGINIAAGQQGLPSFAQGGVVPGPFGRPMLVIAHGGEEFAGIGAGRGTAALGASLGSMIPALVQATAALTAVSRAEIGAAAAGSTTQNAYHYEVNAQYGRVQSEASMAMDLRALIAMARA